MHLLRIFVGISLLVFGWCTAGYGSEHASGRWHFAWDKASRLLQAAPQTLPGTGFPWLEAQTMGWAAAVGGVNAYLVYQAGFRKRGMDSPRKQLAMMQMWVNPCVIMREAARFTFRLMLPIMIGSVLIPCSSALFCVETQRFFTRIHENMKAEERRNGDYREHYMLP